MGDMREVFDEYNVKRKKQQEENYARATTAYNQAQELAFKNGFFLHKHSPWHFSLTYKPKGCAVWLWNLYPANQRIYNDPNFKGPFLEVAKPWTLLDVVAAAIIKSHPAPERIVNEIQKSMGAI